MFEWQKSDKQDDFQPFKHLDGIENFIYIS